MMFSRESLRLTKTFDQVGDDGGVVAGFCTEKLLLQLSLFFLPYHIKQCTWAVHDFAGLARMVVAVAEVVAARWR